MAEVTYNSLGLPIPPALPDSLLTDSVTQPVYGLVITNPVVREEASSPDPSQNALSWVWLFLILLFGIVALKFKNNARYIKAVVDDLTDVRLRANAFDDTVKETSFLILLNLLWVCSCGVLLWKAVRLGAPDVLGNSFSIPDEPATGIGLCTAATGIYALFMCVAYWVIGFVFGDKDKARMWVKGAGASQGLEAILLLPIAALSICYQPWTLILLEIAAGIFILGKFIFIYKGFRIFFSQISSWMLFLYYLCSLEIVPLILTYISTLWLCSAVL